MLESFRGGVTADELVRLYMKEGSHVHRAFDVTPLEQQRCPLHIPSEQKKNKENTEMISKGDDALILLTDETRDIEVRHKPLQTLGFTVYQSDLIPSLWRLMSSTEKQRFLDKYHTPFMAVLAPFAPANGSRLLGHVRRNKLSIRSGIKHVTEVRSESATTSSPTAPYHFIATFTSNNNNNPLPSSSPSPTSTSSERFDLVVNATGSAGFTPYPSTGIITSNDSSSHFGDSNKGASLSTVIPSLITNGLAQAHPFGGLVLDTFCLRVLPRPTSVTVPVSSQSSSSSLPLAAVSSGGSTSFAPSSLIYTVGQEVRGEEWFTSNFGTLIEHMQRIVPSLLPALFAPRTRPLASPSLPTSRL
jgi:hypothetical protein